MIVTVFLVSYKANTCYAWQLGLSIGDNVSIRFQICILCTWPGSNSHLSKTMFSKLWQLCKYSHEDSDMISVIDAFLDIIIQESKNCTIRDYSEAEYTLCQIVNEASLDLMG